METRDTSDLPFARFLVLVGLLILVLGAVLVALPALIDGSLLVRGIAYGVAALFGPMGLSLLGAAWRIRNRALYGTEMPLSHRRRLRVVGGALLGVGLFLVLGGFGDSAFSTRVLSFIWGLALALYGVRFLFRSFAAAE